MGIAIPLLEIDSVSVERSGNRILDHINISIPLGQHVAIIGPNGSGKSTLLKLLMKIFYPSVVDGKAGAIRVLGKEEWNVWELRAQLGYVSSEIDSHFTVGRSGRLTALSAVLTGFSHAELELDPEEITDEMTAAGRFALERVGIESMWHQPLSRMSTGERRRVMLARALVRQPKAIVLDEPTAGLDIVAQRSLLQQLNELAVRGTTLILVTHHFHEVLPCVERTVLLSEGRVFFDGATEAALTSERIGALFGCEVTVARDSNGYYWHHF